MLSRWVSDANHKYRTPHTMKSILIGIVLGWIIGTYRAQLWLLTKFLWGKIFGNHSQAR